MKTSITLLILLGAWIGVIAQAPEAISYQAVARDNSGNLLANQAVSFRLTIYQGIPGPVVYSESHAAITNDYGIATLQIGNGTVISGVFSNINWGLGTYFLQTELDPVGGTAYQNLGTTQMLSVPYALYAKTAGSSGSSLPPGTFGQTLHHDGLSWLANTTLYNTGTNIGIGTTNPQFKLVVTEDASFNSIRVGRGNAGLSSNTGCGFQTLNSVTSGQNNVAFGYQTLKENTTGSNNTAIGYLSLAANINGLDNIAIGSFALINNSSGNYNVAIGSNSLADNGNGGYNVAIGREALNTNIGNAGNTAVGSYAMQNADNRTAGIFSNNTAIGMYALQGSSTPAENTGINNTAIGQSALYSNASGINNTAVGKGTLFYNTDGDYNVALGAFTLGSNTTGNSNTALGYSALYSISTGHSNVAIGTEVGNNVTTGYRNVIIGFHADAASNSVNNSISIGYNASADANNQVRLGNTSISTFYCQGAYAGTVGTTNRDLYADNTGKIGYVSSSVRYKENISSLDDINWLYQLRPVNFNYKNDAGKTIQDGLIAEEVEKIIPRLVSYNEDGSPETISYSSLITPMLKALQNQNRRIEQQQQMIETLMREIEQIKKK